MSLTPEREAEMRRLDAIPTATGGIEDRRLLLAELASLRARVAALTAERDEASAAIANRETLIAVQKQVVAEAEAALAELREDVAWIVQQIEGDFEPEEMSRLHQAILRVCKRLLFTEEVPSA